MASKRRNMFHQNKKRETTEIGHVSALGRRLQLERLGVISVRFCVLCMFYENKKRETTEICTCNLPSFSNLTCGSSPDPDEGSTNGNQDAVQSSEPDSGSSGGSVIGDDERKRRGTMWKRAARSTRWQPQLAVHFLRMTSAPNFSTIAAHIKTAPK
ncbi:hypothetical protein AAG570_004722 [Ranatra chinensis]|uniref:Uncharacterized protein n=1 Tax=Ranatra chinensis TaxID=642074 RepID=A0ABD0Y1R9_9HEMI